jgi:hypothetical protein
MDCPAEDSVRSELLLHWAISEEEMMYYKNVLTQEEYTRIEKIFRDQLIQDARRITAWINSGTRRWIYAYSHPRGYHEIWISVAESDVAVGDVCSASHIFWKRGFHDLHLPCGDAQKYTPQCCPQSSPRKHRIPRGNLSVLPQTSSKCWVELRSPGAIKATARIPIQVLYDFSSSAGQKTIQNTLSDLLDSDTERAEKTLLNHPYIKSIDIRLTPFWANKLPNSLERIYIKVQEVKY